MMGKKLVRSEEEIRKSMTLPSENDVLGVVTKILGQGRVMVRCQDGGRRLCRIRGKMKRRRWVREDDVVRARATSHPKQDHNKQSLNQTCKSASGGRARRIDWESLLVRFWRRLLLVR